MIHTFKCIFHLPGVIVKPRVEVLYEVNMFTGGYNVSPNNNRFWVTEDGNKALCAWIAHVLWCHTSTNHMPHTEFMHACSLLGHKLIRLLSDSQTRKSAWGQILWRTGSSSTASGPDDQVEVYRSSYLSHLTSQVLVGGAVPVSVRASLIIRSTTGTPPSLDLQ